MANWCTLTTDLPGKEESVDISFTKTSTSCGYGLSTIAHIKADEVNNLPQLKASIFNELLCIVIDHSFLLVNLKLETLCFTKLFHTEIDVFCAIKSDSVVIIALRDGYVHVFSVENQCEVYARKVTHPKADTDLTFVGVHDESDSSVILVGQNGNIFRISFTLSDKSDGIFLDDDSSCESVFNFNSKVHGSVLFRNPDGSPYILLSSTAELYHRNDDLTLRSIYVNSSDVVTKICSNKSGSLAVHLSDGKLFFYCAHILMCLKIYDKAKVLDFILLEESNQDFVFASLLDSNGQNVVSLFAVSDFSCRLQCKVNNPCIVDSPNTMDSLIFLDVAVPSNNRKFSDTVIVNKITESNPDFRLANFLKKKLFKEAEKFALDFKLDYQVIYKAQCLHLMEKMQQFGDFSELPQLVSLLEKVEDIDFMINLIQISKVVDLSALKSLLLYCLERLQTDNKEGARFDKLMDDVSKCLILLDTYTMLWHSSEDESWTTFSSRKILESFRKTVIKGDWMQAWVLWERHWEQCVKEIENVDQAMAILDVFPQGDFSKDILSVLEVYTKGVISQIPEAIEEISSWVIHTVRSMERKKDWPKAALEFAERMLLLLSNSTFNDQSIILTKKFTTGEVKLSSASLLYLQSNVECLKDINYIHSEFDVKIKLSEYDQGKKELLAILLIKKVSLEKYDKFTSCYLMKYLTQHQLSLDDVVTEIIEEVHDMTSHSSSYNFRENVPMEKLITLTEHMKDTEKKGKCILLLMKTYPLPWNMKLSTLVNCGLLLDHPISETIKLQLNITNALSILKKYQLEKLDIIHDFHRIIKVIIQSDRREMVEDCLTIAITESNKEEVYATSVKHCFMRREYERAFKIMQPLSKEVVLRILSTIVHELHALLLLCDNKELEYLNILKTIELYVEESYDDEEGKSFFKENSLKELTGIHYIKTYYNLEMQLEEANIESPVMHEVLGQLVEKADDLASKIDSFLQVQQLSHVFKWSVDEIILQLLKRNDNVDALFKLISKLIASPMEDFDSLVDILWWALSSLLGNSVNEDLAQLLRSISCRGIQKCSPGDLSTHLEFCRFLKIWLGSWDLKNQKSFGSRAKHFLPFSHAILHVRHPQWIRLTAPQEFLPRIIALDTNRQLWNDMLLKSNCSRLFSFAANKKCNAANKSYEELYDESNPWLKFQVDSMVMWNSATQYESEMGKLECIVSLLRRIESSKDFDPILMIGLLFCFEKPLAWTKGSISSCNGNYRCMLFNSTVAMALGQILNISEGMKQYEEIYFSCLVYKRLTVLGVSIREDEYFQIQKDDLMKKVVGHKKITEENIEELCHVLHLDVKSPFIKYIQSKLLSWIPQYQVKTSLNAQEECVVTNPPDHILKSFRFIKPMFNKNEVLSFVNELWPKVNLYYYEIYEALLEIMMYFNSDMKFILRQKDLIRFLRKYSRHSSPSSSEIEVSGNMGTMPEISRWRLPLLTCSKNIEKSLTALITPESFVGSIISAEVTFLNYPVWVAGPQIQNFDSSSICLMAIKNEMNTHLKDHRKKRDWHNYPTEEIFLQNVNTCIMQVENVKMATALLKYIMGKLPPGVDQLTAAEMCVKSAQRWVATEVDKIDEATSALEKIEWHYKCLSVTHILHQNGLGQKKYLEMIGSPPDVISELYQDAPNLSVYTTERIGYGVNWAAMDIASIFSINIDKFKLNLISTWISSRKDDLSEFYDSFVGGELFATERQLYSLADDEDMRRLIYICKSMDKNTLMNHLVSLAFMYDEVNESLSTVAKLRVMLCMSEIDHESASEQAALRGITNLGSYIMKLFLLIPLEKSDIVHSISEFDSTCMYSIAKNLLQKNWQSNVGLAAKFCLVTNVFHHSLWENILKIMINSSMCQLLVEILPLLRHHSFFMGIKSYRTAWKTALEISFKASTPMTLEEENQCIACLKVIHLCPFLGDLDLQGMADECIKRSKCEMAALLLPFLPTSKAPELKTKILNHVTPEDVIARIQSLSEQLPICSLQALRILKADDQD